MPDRANERSTWITNVAFTDENGNPVTPSAAEYRIDDVGLGIEIRGDTDISSLAENIDIEWTPSDTTILDQTRAYETRCMTVKWSYAGSKQNTGKYLLDIVNLKGVTTPSPA